MFWFVLAIICFIIALIWCIVGLANGSKGGAFGGLAAFAVIGIVFVVLATAIIVPTGHTGVVTTFGRVENYTLDSGLNWKKPWQNIVKMDNRVQKETTDLACFSSDIQEVAMTYTVNYQIKKADAMTIYSTIGKNYYETVVIPCITESVKTVTARYTAEQLVGMREELAIEIETDLSNKLLSYNIEVVSTSVEDMDFTDAFTNAVEAKQVAQQNKLKAETEAEQAVIEAEAAARVKEVEADADAYELRVRAEAEAAANQQVAASLTDKLIEYLYAQGWDGKLPLYMGGDETVPVLDLTE